MLFHWEGASWSSSYHHSGSASLLSLIIKEMDNAQIFYLILIFPGHKEKYKEANIFTYNFQNVLFKL